MKKVLFSDMDGTIIDHQGLLHQKDKEYIQKLRKQGHLMVYCTGRNEHEVRIALQEYDLPYDYLILNNGAHIIDKDGNDLLKKEIDGKTGIEIIEHCFVYQDCFIFFYDGNRKLHLATCNDKTYIHTEAKLIQTTKHDFFEEYKKSKSFDILCFNQKDEKMDKTMEVKRYLESTYPEVSGCLNTHYLDIVPAGCNKGTGVKALLSLLEEEVESYGIGDSYNDTSMMQEVDHGYTFYRCKDEIKKHADHFVDYVYEVIEDMLGG